MLDVVIEIFGDVLGPRRREKAAMAESARAEFGGALKPADDFSGAEKVRGGIDLVRVGIAEMVGGFAVVEDFLDFLIGEGRAPEGRGHFGGARKFRVAVEGEPCGTESGTFVAGGGLDEDAFETRARFDGGNEERVEKEAACEAQRSCVVFFAKGCEPIADGLFDCGLEARGDVGALLA